MKEPESARLNPESKRLNSERKEKLNKKIREFEIQIDELQYLNPQYSKEQPEYDEDGSYIPECFGKVVHATRKDAAHATKGQRKPYFCNECDAWHTGRMKKKRKK